MVLNNFQLLRLKNAAGAAKSAVKTNPPVPLILTVCQWAIESYWGEDQPGNNPFGIKAAPGRLGQSLRTGEFVGGKMITTPQVFEVFPTLTDAFNRHADILVNAHDGKGNYFYRPSLEQYATVKSLPLLFEGIAKHYATDPEYATKLESIASMDEVLKAVA